MERRSGGVFTPRPLLVKGGTSSSTSGMGGSTVFGLNQKSSNIYSSMACGGKLHNMKNSGNLRRETLATRRRHRQTEKTFCTATEAFSFLLTSHKTPSVSDCPKSIQGILGNSPQRQPRLESSKLVEEWRRLTPLEL